MLNQSSTVPAGFIDLISLVIVIVIIIYFYFNKRYFQKIIGYMFFIVLILLVFWLQLINFLKWSVNIDVFYETEEFLEIIEICVLIFLVYYFNQRAITNEIESYQRILLEHEKFDYIERLSTGIVHDLNNIIGVIDSCTTMMKMEYENNPSVELSKVDPYLLEINKQASRAKAITSNVRDLSKFAHNGEFIKENISNILQEVLSLSISQSKVQIIKEIETDVYGMAIRSELTRVFQNIIKNAIEAMPNGGKLYIRLTMADISEEIKTLLKTHQIIKIQIIDTGIGIRPELLKDIFKPYFTTKTTGTGLGLPISKSIVELHKGTILVDSKLNEGTTFTIYLPCSHNGHLK